MASLLGMVASGLVIGTGFAVSGLAVHKIDQFIEDKISDYEKKPDNNFNKTRLITDTERKDNIDSIMREIINKK